MKNNEIYKRAFTALLVFLSILSAFGQVDCEDPNNKCTRNGYQLPPRGTVRLLFVFAEFVETDSNRCGYRFASNSWPAGQMPSDKNDWVDYQVSANPVTNCSRYYKEISLGELNVIGDYYDSIVQVPCGATTTNSDALSYAIKKLDTIWQPNAQGEYVTEHGSTLADFDMYHTGAGRYKAPGNSNGYIDAVVIIWRNNPYANYSCGGGNGVGASMTPTALKNKTVYLFGSWNGCPEETEKSFFKAEYFHAMFGHNNAHTGGGASYGTFPWPAGSFSTTAQSESASQVICGWDRWFMDWKGPRQFSISALSTAGIETPSDLNMATSTNESTFILRDFVTVGDAIRIKLPHLNWMENGDVKNQYLWIENHQKVSPFDQNKNPCNPWSKGLYTYIQVGKDILTGQELFTHDYCYYKRNELNDHLFPLSAEGSYDLYYDYANQGRSGENCIWGNFYTAYSKVFPDGTSLPNPFTGFSDQYGKFDSNRSGVIDSADKYAKGAYKYIGLPGSGYETRNNWGDAYDAFNQTGQKIYLGSNPAPVPVYTRREGADQLESFENRTIYLNNLSIEILSTDHFGDGTGAYRVKVRWDDHRITNDTRWCGHIRLKNTANQGYWNPARITIAGNKTVTVDQGLSPTRRNNGILQPDGTYLLTDPSALILETGTVTTLESNGILKVQNGSSLIVKNGAILDLNAGSKVIIDGTSHLCVESQAYVRFLHPTASIVINGNIYYGSLDGPVSGTVSFSSGTLPAGVVYANSVEVNGSASSEDYVSTVLKATDYLEFGPNADLQPTAGSAIEGIIQKHVFTNDCLTASDFENLTLSTSVCNSSTSGTDIKGGPDDHHHHDDDDTHDPEPTGLTDANSYVKRYDVFPNPSSGILKIDAKGNWNISSVIIYNSFGQIVYESKGESKSSMELSLYELDEGMYFLRVSSNGITEHQKFLIKK